MTVFAVLVALVLIGGVAQDAFEVMLLPRRVQRPFRLTRLYYRSAWRLWAGASRRIADRVRRENLLGFFGPLSMLMLFALWSVGLILGFGLLQWAAQAPGPEVSPLSEQLYLSGVTFFTLGYGDVVPHTGLARFLGVAEAGTGLGFLAIVIGYLPVLYQLFSRRESHVMRLDARAGSPPTAATMLCRHAEAGALDKLDGVLGDWEVWASELLESHLSYPMLAYYRSQHDNQSWLAALATLMDTCALVLVGVEGFPPLQARMTFMMTRQVVVEMARGFALEPSRFDGGDRLPHDAYLRLQASFAAAGVGWNGEPEAEPTLATLRATYEPLLASLAAYLLLALPDFVAGDGGTDHWERGHRGLIARRLVDELSARSAPASLTPADAGHRSPTWRKLRARLSAR